MPQKPQCMYHTPDYNDVRLQCLCGAVEQIVGEEYIKRSRIILSCDTLYAVYPAPRGLKRKCIATVCSYIILTPITTRGPRRPHIIYRPRGWSRQYDYKVLCTPADDYV